MPISCFWCWSLFLVIVHYLKPKPTSAPGTPPSPSDIAAELVFDKYLAQISLFVDGLADALVATVSNQSEPLFVVLSCLSSFTSGGNPALQSLGAICLHVLGASDQAGALFGAFGVLNSIAHIISVSSVPLVLVLFFTSVTIADHLRGDVRRDSRIFSSGHICPSSLFSAHHSCVTCGNLACI